MSAAETGLMKGVFCNSIHGNGLVARPGRGQAPSIDGAKPWIILLAMCVSPFQQTVESVLLISGKHVGDSPRVAAMA